MTKSQPTQSINRRAAFTLIELLAVVTILLLVATLGFGAIKSAMDKGRMAKEMSIGRSTITGYLNAAADRDGIFLVGMGSDGDKVYDANGKQLHSPVSQRYPYRLGPYIDYAMDRLVTPSVQKLAKAKPDQEEYTYSVMPAFGINAFMVGGDNSPGKFKFPNDYVGRLSDATHAIIAFTTAADGAGSTKTEGYCRVTAPTISDTNWMSSKWKPDSDPKEFGFVDARHNGKALCAFLDGSVRAMSIEELQDMRLWSVNAAYNDDSSYIPPIR